MTECENAMQIRCEENRPKKKKKKKKQASVPPPPPKPKREKIPPPPKRERIPPPPPKEVLSSVYLMRLWLWTSLYVAIFEGDGFLLILIIWVIFPHSPPLILCGHY